MSKVYGGSITELHILSIEEVAKDISRDLPEYQYRANLDFLMNLHYRLKDGGVWIAPALGRIYTKVNHGFVQTLDERIVVEDAPDLT